MKNNIEFDGKRYKVFFDVHQYDGKEFVMYGERKFTGFGKKQFTKTFTKGEIERLKAHGVDLICVSFPVPTVWNSGSARFSGKFCNLIGHWTTEADGKERFVKVSEILK